MQSSLWLIGFFEQCIACLKKKKKKLMDKRNLTIQLLEFNKTDDKPYQLHLYRIIHKSVDLG